MPTGRLWHGIRRWLLIGPADLALVGGDVPVAPRSRSPKARRTGCLTVEAFAVELVRLRDDAAGPSPRLHVFSVSDFRNAVGGKWGRLCGFVEVAVESIIRRHVDTEQDIFTHLDAEIACLAMPNTSRSETRTRVAAIARDIAAHLFGDTVIDGRRPQVLAANLPLDEALTVDGEMDREAIDHALGKAGEALAAASIAGGGHGRSAAMAPHRATLAALMASEAVGPEPRDGASGAAFAISGSGPTQVAAPRWFDPGNARLHGADAERQVLTIPRDHQAKAWKDGAAAIDRVTSTLTPESALTLVWSPTWVTSSRAVGAFHARIIRVDSENAPSLEGVHAYRDLASVEVLTLDRFVTTQVARELKTLFYNGQRVGLTLPIHWMSLSSKWCDCIRMPFEDCPPDARRKFLKIEVFGLSPPISPANLRRMFEPLERIGCDVMVRLPLSAAGIIPSLSHLRAVGVDLAELTEDERVGDDALFARLEEFRAAARQVKIASYVWGVRRRPLIAKVVASGFSLVNGPGVMCDLSRPVLPSRGGVPCD